MKSKYKYVVGASVVFLAGVVTTYLMIMYVPLFQKSETVKTIKEVSIKETDTIKSAIDKVYQAVYVVKSYQGDRLAGTGTAFAYKKQDKTGYLITNHHVIENATNIKVVDMDGREVEAKVLGSDAYSDLAVLSVEANAVKLVANLGSSTGLELGDTLFTIGSPVGENYKGTVTKGILSGKDRTVSVDLKNSSFMMEVLQTDAAINPGNSGGPLVNINGEVIGVNSMKLVEDEIEGMGFAIPIEIVKNELENLEQGKKISRPLIGINLVDASNTYALYYNQINLDKEFEKGIAIASVEKGDPASDAGLQKGDVIVEMNGIEITNSAHFRYILYKYQVGDKIEVKYYRDGKEHKTSVTLKKGIEE